MKRLIIIGAGNSIRAELQNGLWDKLRSEYTFALNDVIYFFEPTVPIFVDWYWYRSRFEAFKNYSLVLGKYDAKIFATHPEIKVPDVSDNTIFLHPSNNKYYGKESLEKGIYSGALCGCFGLTLGIALDFEEIYLLGFDFCAIDGKTHFYEKDKLKEQIIGIIKEKDGSIRCGIGKDKRGHYRTGVYNNNSKVYFDVYKEEKETKIFNVSLKSKISLFPKISYKEFYKRLNLDHISIDQDLARSETKQIIENKLGDKE